MSVAHKISLNVNGLGNPIKRSKVIAKLRKAKPSVVFLQETHLSKKKILKNPFTAHVRIAEEEG